MKNCILIVIQTLTSCCVNFNSIYLIFSINLSLFLLIFHVQYVYITLLWKQLRNIVFTLMILRNIFLFLLFFSLAFDVCSQEPQKNEPYGRVSGVIFTNFHRGISPASSDESAIELVRAYFGYEHFISPEYSARIMLDIGSPDDVSPFSRLRRYAYFKFAYGQYVRENLTIQFGLIPTLHYKLQEQLWERRYMKKAFADEYKLGPSADLGAMVGYKLLSSLEADFSVMNGEGFSRLQMDDKYKYAFGLTYQFSKELLNRIYFDYTRNEVSQFSYVWLVSYTFKNNFNLVFEYNYQQNNNLKKDKDLFGYSVYGKYNINPKFQLFTRFDMLKSNIVEGDITPWQLSADGSTLISGLQYTPIKGIKMALNYQDWVPRAINMPTRSFVYFDMEIRM